MVSLKKAALAVLALGVTGVASAAMYMPPAAAGCTVGNNVTVPCEKKGWSFAADALYVQTNNVGAVTSNVTGGFNTADATGAINNNVGDLGTDWNWGFQLAAAYYFGTGNDVNINWTHFVHSTEETDTAASGVMIGNYLSDILNTGASQNQVYTKLDNDFNSVNFEFGQLVHFGEHVDSRFHGGLQWAQIDETLTQTGSNTSVAAANDTNVIDSDFDGIGPRFGADTAYNFGNGFSLFGNVAGALLIGSINTTQTETFTNTAGAIVGQATSSSDTGNTVVPEAEAKLGVRFTKAMAQGDLSAEVGYQAVNYWNAQNITDYNDVGNSDESDFGYNGIFFGLKWMGNA
jgi:hypothetical protein